MTVLRLAAAACVHGHGVRFGGGAEGVKEGPAGERQGPPGGLRLCHLAAQGEAEAGAARSPAGGQGRGHGDDGVLFKALWGDGASLERTTHLAVSSAAQRCHG